LGFTDLIQAMIFQISVSVLNVLPKGGIGDNDVLAALAHEALLPERIAWAEKW